MESIQKSQILRVNCPGFGEDGYFTVGKARAFDTYKVIIVNPTSILHVFDQDANLRAACDSKLAEGAASLNLPADQALLAIQDELKSQRIFELVNFLDKGGLLIYFLCNPFLIQGETMALDNYYWLETLAPDSPPADNIRQMSVSARGRIVELTEYGEKAEFAFYLRQGGMEWSTIIRSNFLTEGYAALATAGEKKCISAELIAGERGGKIIFLPAPYSPDFDVTLMQCVQAWHDKNNRIAPPPPIVQPDVAIQQDRLPVIDRAVIDQSAPALTMPSKPALAPPLFPQPRTAAAVSDMPESTRQTHEALMKELESLAMSNNAQSTDSIIAKLLNPDNQPAQQPITSSEASPSEPATDNFNQGNKKSSTAFSAFKSKSLFDDIQEKKQKMESASRADLSPPDITTSISPFKAPPDVPTDTPPSTAPSDIAGGNFPFKTPVDVAADNLPFKALSDIAAESLPFKIPPATAPLITPAPESARTQLDSHNQIEERIFLEKEHTNGDGSTSSSPSDKSIVGKTNEDFAIVHNAESATINQSAPDAKDLMRKMQEVSKIVVPDWCSKFTLPDIEGWRKERDVLVNEIKEAHAKIVVIDNKIAQMDNIKNALLASEDEALLAACARVFARLGWIARNSDKNKEELLLESPDQTLLIARIVRTPSQAKRTDIAQLAESIINFWGEHEIEPKGVLVACTWVNRPPDERTEPDFTDALIEFAQKQSLCLLSTVQLLGIYRDLELARAVDSDIRRQILATNGLLPGFALETAKA